MRRLRTASVGARLALLLVAALLAGALQGAAPRAAAETPPGGAPAASAAPPAPATPLLSLPTGAVASEPLILREPEQGPKTAGLTQAEAQAINFGRARPTLQQQSLSAACAPMITNSTIFGNEDESGNINIYDWTVYRQQVYYRQDFYYSPPFALSMEDGDEGPDVGNRDEDWFGQDFFFPEDGRSLLIEFSVRYSSPSTYSSGRNYALDRFDYAYFEIYRVDPEGNLVDEDPSTTIMNPVVFDRLDPRFPDEEGYNPAVDDINLDEWYRFRLFFSENRSSFAKLKGQRVALVFDQDGDTLEPYEEPIVDNPQVTVCPSPGEPSNNIYGFVERNKLPPSGEEDLSITNATMVLIYSPDGVSTELVRTTYPEASGRYRFSALPDLPPGGYYQAWYLKNATEDDPNTPDDDRISYYAGPRITQDMFDASADGSVYSGIYEILDVGLVAPIAYSEVAGNVAFSWTPSPLNGASYSLCFFDPDTFDESCEKPTTNTSATVSTAALAANWPAFAYNEFVGWYVRVLGPEYDPAAFAHIGASGYSNYIKFLPEAVSVPEPPPADNTQLPAAEGDKAWTLMFYMAGDDEDLTTPPGFARSMQDMVPALIGLADRHPNVNIVAQFDFYETDKAPLDDEVRGTQLCYFKPGVRDLSTLCRQLGEQNTASPATLTNFINTALTSYPAPRRALIILGHGSPVTGVAGDRTGDELGRDDAMDPGELNEALANANLGRKLDALVFYNCLMGSYEVAALAAQYADYMVASPNITTLIDINAQIVDLASDNPGDPRAFAAGIVGAYNQALASFNAENNQNLSIAMAAYDLGKLPTISAAVEGLARALTNDLSRQEVKDARGGVQQYDSSAPVLWGFNPGREDALIDLGHLAAQLAANPASLTSIRTAANEVLSALGTSGSNGAFVIANIASSGRADQRSGGSHSFAPDAATGLSIYFPNGNTDGSQPALTRMYYREYKQLAAVSLQWIELVDATRTGLPSLPRGIRLGGLAGAPGTTLQNVGTPELFPPAPNMPGGSALHLPLIRR